MTDPKNKLVLKILLVVSFEFLLLVLFRSGLFSLLYFSKEHVDITEILGLCLFILFIIVIVYTLTSFSLNDKLESMIFFLLSYTLAYMIIISPGLSIGGLFNNDSFFHLHIVKNFQFHVNFDLDLFYGDFGDYGNYFFHQFIALTSNLTQIDSHTLFLFFPQIIMFSFFFLGVYLIIFNFFEEKLKRKQFFFLIFIFFPRFIFQNAAFHPFFFVVSLTPIIVYLSLNFSKHNVLILTIFLLFSLQVHIYGSFLLIISIVVIIINYINEKLKKIEYKAILTFIWVVYGFCLISVLIPELVEFIVNLLPLHEAITARIIRDFNSGGALFQMNGATPSMQSIFEIKANNIQGVIKIVFDWFVFYIPIILVISKNQYSYFRQARMGKRYIGNKNDQFRLISDLFFIFFIICIFHGAGILLERTIILIFFVYLLLSLHFVFQCFEFIKERFAYHRKLNIPKLLFKKKLWITSFVLMILMFSLIPFTSYRFDTINERYNAIEWINENIPDDSIFLASYLRLNHVLKGLTQFDTTSNCSDLFDFSKNESLRINTYLNNPYTLKRSFYLIIDLVDDMKLEIVWEGDPGVGNKLAYLKLMIIQSYIEESSFYSLIYKTSNGEILIYRMGL